MQAIIYTFYIYCHNPVKIFLGCGVGLPNMCDAGIVYQYIYCFMFLSDLCYYGFYFLLVSNIAFKKTAFSTFRSNLFNS